MTKVKVKALKSFDFDGEIKTPNSKPFEIDGSRVNQFESLGLIERIKGETLDDDSSKMVKKNLERGVAYKAVPDSGAGNEQGAQKRGRKKKSTDDVE